MQNKKTTNANTAKSGVKPERYNPNAKRVIKKYPNRRLYDTDTSAYITLSEVKRLVMASEGFEVRDAKTGEDLTRSILLQIILEEEANGSPMFTPEVLSNVIRFYGHAMQGFMGGFLEKSIQTMVEMQTRLGEQASHLTPEVWSQFMGLQSPMMQGLMGKNLENSKNLFTQMQEQMKEQMQRQTEQMLSTFGVKR
jgi:polyhydroxyalkanoate synthesis repressor PhaR